MKKRTTLTNADGKIITVKKLPKGDPDEYGTTKQIDIVGTLGTIGRLLRGDKRP